MFCIINHQIMRFSSPVRMWMEKGNRSPTIEALSGVGGSMRVGIPTLYILPNSNKIEQIQMSRTGRILTAQLASTIAQKTLLKGERGLGLL